LRNKKDFKTELLLNPGLSFKAYKTLSSPYSRIFLQNGTKIKIYDVHLKLRLMLKSRAKYTVFEACRSYKRGIFAMVFK